MVKFWGKKVIELVPHFLIWVSPCKNSLDFRQELCTVSSDGLSAICWSSSSTPIPPSSPHHHHPPFWPNLLQNLAPSILHSSDYLTVLLRIQNVLITASTSPPSFPLHNGSNIRMWRKTDVPKLPWLFDLWLILKGRYKLQLPANKQITYGFKP